MLTVRKSSKITIFNGIFLNFRHQRRYIPSLMNLKLPHLLTVLALILVFGICAQASPNFVQVKGTQFILDQKPYRFLGTNFWYGMNLGMTSPSRERLVRELDRLKNLGVTNLRILGLSEGPDTEPWRVVPALQKKPGEYSE